MSDNPSDSRLTLRLETEGAPETVQAVQGVTAAVTAGEAAGGKLAARFSSVDDEIKKLGIDASVLKEALEGVAKVDVGAGIQSGTDKPDAGSGIKTGLLARTAEDNAAAAFMRDLANIQRSEAAALKATDSATKVLAEDTEQLAAATDAAAQASKAQADALQGQAGAAQAAATSQGILGARLAEAEAIRASQATTGFVEDLRADAFGGAGGAGGSSGLGRSIYRLGRGIFNLPNVNLPGGISSTTVSRGLMLAGPAVDKFGLSLTQLALGATVVGAGIAGVVTVLNNVKAAADEARKSVQAEAAALEEEIQKRRQLVDLISQGSAADVQQQITDKRQQITQRQAEEQNFIQQYNDLLPQFYGLDPFSDLANIFDPVLTSKARELWEQAGTAAGEVEDLNKDLVDLQRYGIAGAGVIADINRELSDAQKRRELSKSTDLQGAVDTLNGIVEDYTIGTNQLAEIDQKITEARAQGNTVLADALEIQRAKIDADQAERKAYAELLDSMLPVIQANAERAKSEAAAQHSAEVGAQAFLEADSLTQRQRDARIASINREIEAYQIAAQQSGLSADAIADFNARIDDLEHRRDVLAGVADSTADGLARLTEQLQAINAEIQRQVNVAGLRRTGMPEDVAGQLFDIGDEFVAIVQNLPNLEALAGDSEAAAQQLDDARDRLRELGTSYYDLVARVLPQAQARAATQLQTDLDEIADQHQQARDQIVEEAEERRDEIIENAGEQREDIEERSQKRQIRIIRDWEEQKGNYIYARNVLGYRQARDQRDKALRDQQEADKDALDQLDESTTRQLAQQQKALDKQLRADAAAQDKQTRDRLQQYWRQQADLQNAITAATAALQFGYGQQQINTGSHMTNLYVINDRGWIAIENLTAGHLGALAGIIGGGIDPKIYGLLGALGAVPDAPYAYAGLPIPQFAEGGIVTRDGLAIMDRGDVILPPVAGRMSLADAGFGGGDQYIFEFHGTKADFPDFERRVRRIVRDEQFEVDRLVKKKLRHR